MYRNYTANRRTKRDVVFVAIMPILQKVGASKHNNSNKMS